MFIRSSFNSEISFNDSPSHFINFIFILVMLCVKPYKCHVEVWAHCHVGSLSCLKAQSLLAFIVKYMCTVFDVNALISVHLFVNKQDP